MNLAQELARRPTRLTRSPWPGHEHVRGYGVMSLPFTSGHVLALRVVPESDFGPYTAVWHASPAEAWSIYVDGPSLGTACPRYFGPALTRAELARIEVEWTAPNSLVVRMDEPALTWELTIGATWLQRVLNPVSAHLPLASWRPSALVRAREWLARAVFDLGPVQLRGPFPSGHAGTMMPQRIYAIPRATANLDGEDLGAPATADAVSIGGFQLPRRPTFAIGEAHMLVRDQVEYEQLVLAPRAGLASQRV